MDRINRIKIKRNEHEYFISYILSESVVISRAMVMVLFLHIVCRKPIIK